MYNGAIGDMTELGVAESFKSKLCVLMIASEAAEMILRVDGKAIFLHCVELFHFVLFQLISYCICADKLILSTDIIRCAPRAREGGGYTASVVLTSDNFRDDTLEATCQNLCYLNINFIKIPQYFLRSQFFLVIVIIATNKCRPLQLE